MARIVPPNYFAVPSELIIKAKIFALASTRTLPANPFQAMNDLMGVTNFTLTFTLNTGIFRGIGDSVQVRKPTHWDATLDITRFITDATFGGTPIVSIFKEIGRYSSNTGGFIFGSDVVGNYVMSVMIRIPNATRSKYLEIRFIGAFTNATITAERTRVEETVSLAAYTNGCLFTEFAT